MRIKLFFKRTATDGFAIDEAWDVEHLPRIGERVYLPEQHLQTITENEPSLAVGVVGVPRRYQVVDVEHRWDDIAQVPCVSICRISDAR